MPDSDQEEWPVIGIDLGTTNSCVAVWRNDRVEIIRNDQGNPTTPSCVAFVNTQRLIGDAALVQATRNPENTIFDAKRLIGKRFNDAAVQTDIKSWSFQVIERPGDTDNKPVIKVSYSNEDKHFSPEEISSMILEKMKETAEAYLGTIVKNAVITVPAYFNDSQRQATKDAGKIAGLNVMRIINEPTAAVFAYGLDKSIINDGAKRNVLVFDLGGGTFDVSLVCMKKNSFEVKSVGGDTHLGGADFSRNMVVHFIEEFKRIHKVDIGNNPKSLGKLRKACEEAKKSLSLNHEASIEIDSVYDGIDFSSSITRATFEKLNLELFRKSIKPVDQCLRDAKMNKSDINDIVLVGGSTRIPKIQQLLKEFFDGRPLCRDINPDEAVAHGAAVHAALMAGVCNKKEIVLFDVAPLSLGIEIAGGEMDIIVPRNTITPTKKVLQLTTSFNYQTEVSFKVYEGERPQAKDNNFLGMFVLSGIAPALKGFATFDLWFDIDVNGILTASAQDANTKNMNQIIVSNQSRFSKEEVDRMTEEAKKYKVEDARYKRKMIAKNALQDYAYKTLEQRLTNEDKIKIEAETNNAIEWLNWNNDTKGILLYDNKLKELKDFCDPIIAHSSNFFAEEAKKLEAQRKKKLAAKKALEDYANNTLATLKDNEQKFISYDMTNIENEIMNALQWLNRNNNDTVDILMYKEKLNELQKFCDPLIARLSESMLKTAWNILSNPFRKSNSQEKMIKSGKTSKHEEATNGSETIIKEVEDAKEGLGSSKKAPTEEEVYAELLKVPGIQSSEALKAVKRFINFPGELETLEDISKEQKLQWVLLCLEG